MKPVLYWDDVRIFLSIARHGTLSGAAAALEMGVATVSRRLDRLEAALAVPLFSRHQSGYRLTDDGRALLARAEALENAGDLLSQAAQSQGQVAGTVRLATAENLATPLIIPSLGKLFSRHRDLNIEIVSGVQTVNLHRREADLAVRLLKPETGNVTIKRLGTLGFGLYASRDYAAARQLSREGANFDKADFIGWTQTHSHLPAARWIAQFLKSGNRFSDKNCGQNKKLEHSPETSEGKNALTRMLRSRPCKLEVNSLSMQLAAASQGLGLAVLPHYLAHRAGLICLLSDMEIDQPIWLVIHTDLIHSKRVRVVADHLIDLFEEKKSELEQNAIQ